MHVYINIAKRYSDFKTVSCVIGDICFIF